MFEIESQCPKCGNKNKVEHETRREMIKGAENDLNIPEKDFANEDAFIATRVYDVVCNECSEKYPLEDSENWDEIEKIIKENL